VELQHNSTKKATTATQSPSSSYCGVVPQLHEEGDGSNAVAFFFCFFTALQRNEKGNGSVAFFFSFFTALQRSEEGDNIWLATLFPCNEVLCLFFPKSKIKYV